MSQLLQETEVSCNDGRFIVNERLVRRIIESYYRAKANIQFGKAKEMDTSWYEPGIKYFEVDWEKARAWTQQQTTSKLYSTWMVSMPTMRPRIDELRQMQRDTALLTRDFRRKVRDLEKESARSRGKMVDFWGDAASAAKVVRDGSASTLMVGATVISAGSAAALFAGGAGTVIRFTAKLTDGRGKWQDNIGAASVQAAGDLLFTFVPATKAGASMRGVKGAEEAALMFIEAAWDSSVSLLEGKEVSEAVLDGSMSLLFDASKKLPGSVTKELKGSLAQWAYPIMIRGTGNKKAGVQAAKTIARGAVDFGHEQVKSAVTSPLNNIRSGGASGAISQQILKKKLNRNGLDHAAIVDEGLVDRAVRRLR